MVSFSLQKDTYRHRGLRKQLVAQLKAKGIEHESVLEAIGKVPRHLFLDTAFEELAYRDQPLPIGFGQTISQPFTVAYQTMLLDVHKRQKVLEIGTGSGYQTAILSTLGARVFTIERQEGLYLKTREFLKDFGLAGVRTFFGDGYLGLPEFGPFDRIIVTAGATNIPLALKNQLAVGGIMIIPVGDDREQKMIKIIKTAENKLIKEVFEKFRFVPFIGGTNTVTKQ